MGFRQTAAHKSGKGSFHQVGLVRGQFGNVPEAQWLTFIADAGFDGWEEASWERKTPRELPLGVRGWRPGTVSAICGRCLHAARR
jgi:hypothetical protein